VTNAYRPRRTCLSVPGSNQKMIDKAKGLPADEVFLDLEDAVAPDAKAAARTRVAAALAEPGWAGQLRGVRVNDWTTPWTHADIIEVVSTVGAAPDAKLDVVVLPKVSDVSHVQALDLLLTQLESVHGLPVGGIGIDAQIEDARGLMSVDAIAAEPRVQALVLGPADLMASLKATRPDLRIIVTGSGIDEETILKAIASGAKGYVDEAASPAEFVQAIRVVNEGSVWAPRHVLSMFIERVSSSPGRIFPSGRVSFTDREKEVLEMLVAGRSNKEIGSALGIEERTVKAHVAKLMRKVGVQNRIALSVHAITHNLVTAK